MTEQERSSKSDELRRMLDELGVEWYELVGHPVVVGTAWNDRDGYPCIAFECADDVPDGMLNVQANLTPEQAIAVTLGAREQPPYDELIEVLRRDWDVEASWDELRRFWYIGLTDEGVRKRDERETALGRRMCHKLPADSGTTCVVRRRGFEMEFGYWKCSNCGVECFEGAKYCMNCGAKVADE